MRDIFYWVFTPLNVSLLLVLVTVIYLRFRPTPAIELPNGPAATVFRTFTPRTLLPNNGTKDKPVYLAVKGKVYDVTAGRNFYGPGGPYENFAGRDATRGLACQSFDEAMLTKDLDGPLDPCEDLTADQIENLNGWVERFDEKVSCNAVGTAAVTDCGLVSGCWKPQGVQDGRCFVLPICFNAGADKQPDRLPLSLYIDPGMQNRSILYLPHSPPLTNNPLQQGQLFQSRDQAVILPRQPRPPRVTLILTWTVAIWLYPSPLARCCWLILYLEHSAEIKDSALRRAAL